MSFQLRPVVEADMADFTRVACDAITDPEQGNPGGEYIRACWPRMDTPAGRANAQLRFTQMLQFMPPGSLTKVVDTAAGDKLVGMAVWSTYAEQPQGYPPLELGDYWESEDEKQYGQYTWDEVMSEYLRHYKNLTPPFMALEIMCVDPAYYRRGVGTMLVKEGVERAEQLGAPVFVNATSRAAFLYEKLGFVTLEGQPMAFKRIEKYADRPGTGTRCLVRPKPVASH